jgi:hypothetical protein
VSRGLLDEGNRAECAGLLDFAARGVWGGLYEAGFLTTGGLTGGARGPLVLRVGFEGVGRGL